MRWSQYRANGFQHLTQDAAENEKCLLPSSAKPFQILCFLTFKVKVIDFGSWK